MGIGREQVGSLALHYLALVSYIVQERMPRLYRIAKRMFTCQVFLISMSLSNAFSSHVPASMTDSEAKIEVKICENSRQTY